MAVSKKAKLLAELAKCAQNPDQEKAHCDADELLKAYIGDDEIIAAYNSVPKWYA